VRRGRADEMHWEIVASPERALIVGEKLWEYRKDQG